MYFQRLYFKDGSFNQKGLTNLAEKCNNKKLYEIKNKLKSEYFHLFIPQKMIFFRKLSYKTRSYSKLHLAMKVFQRTKAQRCFFVLVISFVIYLMQPHFHMRPHHTNPNRVAKFKDTSTHYEKFAIIIVNTTYQYQNNWD